MVSWHQASFVSSILERNFLVVTDEQVTRKVPYAVARCFCLQSTEFCAEGMHSLITRCDDCVNLQGDHVVKYGIGHVSREKCCFEQKVAE